MFRQRRAFTLTEILVAVGIIAVLIGILIPAIGGANRQARSAQCQANLRQLSVAFNSYVAASENRSFGAPADNNTPSWVGLLAPHLGGTLKVHLCPEADDPPSDPSGVGTARQAWRAGTEESGQTASYGFNGWLYRQYPPMNEEKRPYVFLPAEGDTARIPVFADAIWYDGRPRTSDAPGEPAKDPDSMRRFTILRHPNKTVNVVFLDGHAEAVRLPELWKLQWNRVDAPADVNYPAW